MKQGKKPTLAERKIMAQWRLNSDNWFVCKHTTTEMVVEHRHTGTKRTIRLG